MVFPEKAMPQHTIHQERASHSMKIVMSSRIHSNNKVRLKNLKTRAILHLSQLPRSLIKQYYCSPMLLRPVIPKSEI